VIGWGTGSERGRRSAQGWGAAENVGRRTVAVSLGAPGAGPRHSRPARTRREGTTWAGGAHYAFRARGEEASARGWYAVCVPAHSGRGEVVLAYLEK
jgi:hypothetical protein